jgi:HK97 family phage major capsid protein
VQTEVAASILEAMKDYSALRASGLPEIIRSTMGNPMQFPTSDGTAEEGEIIAQNQTATDLDISFGTLSLDVFKFSSKVVTVPIELLQDSNANIEAFVVQRLAQRLGRITERMFTTGTGTNQPRGVITAASVGVAAATGNTTAITYDHLVDLEHSINRAYRTPDCAFMMNDNTLKFVRKIKDGQQRPIFVPGYETGVPGGAPDTLLGRRLVINEMMADLGANAKPVAFGNFSYYKIRDVMDMTLSRYTDSAYNKKGQVGFLAWSRHGGNLIDVGGAVKVYQNSAT